MLGKPFRIENKQQDEGWRDSGIRSVSKDIALPMARKFSKRPSVWGMVRVVDVRTGEVIATYSSGKESPVE
jgi:hypothetical protein